jgi:hypothetical protein
VRRTGGIACALVLLMAGAEPAVAACAVGDVEVRATRLEHEAGWFTVTGEAVNRCAEPTAAQLELTFRDEAGQVVSVDESWPTATRNLRPGPNPLQLSLRAYATAKSVSVRVTAVRPPPAR